MQVRITVLMLTVLAFHLAIMSAYAPLERITPDEALYSAQAEGTLPASIMDWSLPVIALIPVHAATGVPGYSLVRLLACVSAALCVLPLAKLSGKWYAGILMLAWPAAWAYGAFAMLEAPFLLACLFSVAENAPVSFLVKPTGVIFELVRFIAPREGFALVIAPFSILKTAVNGVISTGCLWALADNPLALLAFAETIALSAVALVADSAHPALITARFVEPAAALGFCAFLKGPRVLTRDRVLAVAGALAAALIIAYLIQPAGRCWWNDLSLAALPAAIAGKLAGCTY